MMNSNDDESPKPQKKGKWVLIGVLLAAAILAFDFVTKGIGVVEKIHEICCTPPPPPASVAVKAIDADWGGQCLEFAFENLPKQFALGKITLDVQKTAGPSILGGNQAAEILNKDVNAELPATLLANPKPIEFEARVQATKDRDAAYLNYCPTLNRPGIEGTLTVQARFFTPTGTPLDGLTLKYPETGVNSVTFSVSRPRNLVPNLTPSQARRVQ